jgi:hypothetical protein
MLLWESGDVEPDPTGVRVSCYGTGGWYSPMDVFSGASFDPDDWCGAWLAGEQKLHVVRATLAGAYEHAVVTDQGGAVAASPPPPLARTGRTGLVLLSDGASMTLVDVASDETLQAIGYRNGAWDAVWTTLDPVPRLRTRLSGVSIDAATASSSGGSAVIWTQTTTNNYVIAGMLVHPGSP